MTGNIKESIETDLTVPPIAYSEDKEITYFYPGVEGSYKEIGKNILDRGGVVPTGDTIYPLVYMSMFSDEKLDEMNQITEEFEEISKFFGKTSKLEKTLELVEKMTEKMEEFNKFEEVYNLADKGLVVFNKNIWTSQGVYVIHDLEAKGCSEKVNISELENALSGGEEIKGVRFSQNGKVRFTSKEAYKPTSPTIFGSGKRYFSKEVSPKEMTQDPFTIANFGINGAEAMGRIAYLKNFRFNPRIYGVDVKEGEEPDQRILTIRTHSGPIGGGLSILGNTKEDETKSGLTFGIKNIKEISLDPVYENQRHRE